jgi:surfeit locus 1 family protein
VVVAAICVRLGVWQLDRLDQRRAFNTDVRAALASDPVALASVLAGGEDPAYRRVSASGRWDRTHELILFGRSLDGRPGNHVVTPFLLEDGRAVLVDRGWVPTEVSEPPVTGDAAAADGPVRIEGIVLPSADADADADADAASEPLPPQVRAIDVGALDAAIPAALVADVYLLLEQQSPPASRPVPAPLPELTEGPHLSYAIQWFAFAGIALIGYGLLARRGGRAVAQPEATSA